MRHLMAMVLVAGALFLPPSISLAGFDVSHYGGVGDKQAESADQKAGAQVYGSWREAANYRVAWSVTMVADKGEGKNSWVIGTKVDIAANGTYMITQEVRTYYSKAQWKAAYPKDDPGKLGYAPFDADGDQKADGYVSPLKSRPPVNARTGRPESSGFAIKIGWNVADPGDPDAANAKEAIALMGTMAGDPNVVISSSEEIDQKARLAQARQHGERGIALGNNLYALSRGGIGGAKGMQGLDSSKGPGTGPVLSGTAGDKGGGASKKDTGVSVDKGSLGSAGYLKGGALGAATEKLINKGAPNLGLEQGSFGKGGTADKASADAMINAGQLAGGLGTGPAGAGNSGAGRQQGGVTAGAGAQQGAQGSGSVSVGTDTAGQWDRTHQGSFGDSGFGGTSPGGVDSGADAGGGAGTGDAAGTGSPAGTGTTDAGAGGTAAGAGDGGNAAPSGAAAGGSENAAGFGQGEAGETGGGVTSGTGGGGIGAGQENADGSYSWQDKQGNTYTDYGDGTMDVTHHDQPIEWTEDGQKKTGTGDVTVGYGQNEDGSWSRTSDEGSASNVQGSDGEDRDDLDGMPVDVTTQDQGGGDGGGGSEGSTESGGSDSGGSQGSTESGGSQGSTDSGSSDTSGSTSGSSGSGDATEGEGEGDDDDADDEGEGDSGGGGDGSGGMTNPYDDDPDSEGGGLPFALGGEVMREGMRGRITGAVEYTPGTDDEEGGGRGPAPNSGLAANAALREQLFNMVGFQPGDVGEGGGSTGPKPNTGSWFSRIVSAIKSFLGFREQGSASASMLGRGAASFRQVLPIGLTVGSTPGSDSGGDATGTGVTLGPDGKPVKGPMTGPNTNLGTQSGTQQVIQR